MEGEKEEESKLTVQQILETGYVPNLVDLIYAEATPKTVLENPFQINAKIQKKPSRHGGAHEKGQKEGAGEKQPEAQAEGPGTAEG